MKGRRSRSRGFTLIELIISFGLITVTLAVVSGSFIITHQAIDQIRKRDDDIAGARRLARTFRMDVARAQSVRVDEEGQQCELRTGEGAVIYVRGGKSLRRTVRRSAELVQRDRFFTRSCEWHFEHSDGGPLVSVTVTPHDGPTFVILAAHGLASGMEEVTE